MWFIFDKMIPGRIFYKSNDHIMHDVNTNGVNTTKKVRKLVKVVRKIVVFEKIKYQFFQCYLP